MLILASLDGAPELSTWRNDLTALAVPQPYLARLFNRLDAADASDPLLRRELEFWRDKRASRLMPTAADLAPGPDAIATHVLVCRRADGTNEWKATRTGPEAGRLLGLASQEKRISPRSPTRCICPKSPTTWDTRNYAA
jgi:hypothetical protein